MAQDVTTPDPRVQEDVAADVRTAQDNPQGAAADVSQGAPTQEPDLAGPPPMPKKFVPPRGMHGRTMNMSADDQLLFGPQEVNHAGGVPPTYGTGPAKYVNARPVNYGQFLPALMQAARDPEASPALQQLIKLLQYHTEGH